MGKRLVRVTAAAAAAALVVGSVPAVRLQAVPQQAAGSPIFRPCGELVSSIARMQRGLSTQKAWLDSAEQQLRDAQQGALASREALRAKARNALGELITNQLQEMVTLRQKVEFLKSIGLSKQTRRSVLEAAKKLEEIHEFTEKMKEDYDGLVQRGKSFDAARSLRDSKKKLEDFLAFAESSGLADGTVSLLATAGGPIGQLTAQTAKTAIDWSLAIGESMVSEQELRRAQEDLGRLRSAYERNRTIIMELETERAAAAAEGQCPEMSDPNPRPASSLTAPLPDPPAASPPNATPVPSSATTPPTVAEKKQGGGGDALYWTLLGSGVGGAYLYREYQKSKGAQCTVPSVNPLSVCSTQGGSSQACQSALAEQRAYCTCLGLGYSGGQCTG